MEIGSGQGLTASQVWLANPKRLTIGGANVPSGSTLQATNLGAQSLLATGTFLQLNQSGTPGVLLVAGIIVSVALAGGVSTVSLNIVVDSNPAYQFPIYGGALTWDPAGQTLADSVVGTGSAVGNSISWPFTVQFNTSLQISIQIVATTLTAGAIIPCTMVYTHA